MVCESPMMQRVGEAARRSARDDDRAADEGVSSPMLPGSRGILRTSGGRVARTGGRVAIARPDLSRYAAARVRDRGPRAAGESDRGERQRQSR